MTPSPAARTLTLSMPLPPPELLPNALRRLHWAKRAEIVKGYRAYCCVLVQANSVGTLLGKPLDPARIDVRYECCKGRRSPDADGALSSLKACIDALVDARVLKGDGPKHVRYGSVEVARHKRGCDCRGRVVVTITEQTQ